MEKNKIENLKNTIVEKPINPDHGHEARVTITLVVIFDLGLK